MRPLLVILIMASCEFASAQRDIYFGIKGGINFQSLGATGRNADNPVGYHFGGLAIMPEARHAFQAELIISEHQEKTIYFYPNNAINRYWYINLPLIYKRYVGGKGFNIQGGLQYGIMAYAYGVNFSIVDVEPTLGRKRVPASGLLSAALGVGWDFKKGPTIDLRYNAGLTDRHTEQDGWFNRNLIIQLSVGYQFKRMTKSST